MKKSAVTGLYLNKVSSLASINQVLLQTYFKPQTYRPLENNNHRIVSTISWGLCYIIIVIMPLCYIIIVVNSGKTIRELCVFGHDFHCFCIFFPEFLEVIANGIFVKPFVVSFWMTIPVLLSYYQYKWSNLAIQNSQNLLLWEQREESPDMWRNHWKNLVAMVEHSIEMSSCKWTLAFWTMMASTHSWWAVQK